MKYFLSIAFQVFLLLSGRTQILADSQTYTVNATCTGCSIMNPSNDIDSDQINYSTMNLTVGTLGANIIQNLNFSTASNVGEYVGIIVEDTNLVALDATLLSAVTLTTYSNNVSNNDTKNSTQYAITLLPGTVSKYKLEFSATSDFDALELKFEAGNAGAVNSLRIYYAYHNPIPLSITLSYFSAIAENGHVKLQWITESETNNAFFTIEQSYDGILFNAKTNIKGNNNSTSIKNYECTDLPEKDGIIYYRLKQTDYSNKYSYSKMITVNFKSIKTQFSFFPNPSNGTFNLKYELEDIDNGEFIICDLSGQKIDSYYLDPTNNNLIVNKSNLNKGIYHSFYIINNQILYPSKLIIQ